MDYLSMLTLVAGGLGIFMFGMRLLSDGTQALAGPKLNKLISAVTDNRILAVLVGMGVTCVIQSSSATTVMVVGFVNSGIMTLMQAIGVIFGANIGTTITAWIMTLNLSKYGLLIAGVAALFYLFGKKEKLHFWSMTILGIGLLFFGLESMSSGFSPLRDHEGIRSWLTTFDARCMSGFLIAMLAGALVTGLIQSSSAFVGITMSLTATGVVNFPTAIALTLGSNIGTTVTALLSCIGTSRNAIRAALAHSLFNIIGVAMVVPIYHSFTTGCEALTEWIAHLVKMAPSPDVDKGVYPYPMLGIAVTHTVFNVATTLIMLPFMGVFAKLVTLMLPVKASETKPERYTPKYLDKHLLKQPRIALGQAQKEILLMGDTCLGMLADLDTIFEKPTRDADFEDTVFRREEDMDVAQMEISEYISNLLQDNITHAMAVTVRHQLRQADEFESVSDYVRNALKSYLKIRDADEMLSDEANAEVRDLTRRCSEYCVDVMALLKTNNKHGVDAARLKSDEIDKVAKDYRERHLQRVATSCSAPVKSLTYSDLLVAFRRINDHLLNIAETLVE